MAIMYVPESENEPRAQGGIQVPRRKKRRMAMPEERGEQTTFAQMARRRNAVRNAGTEGMEEMKQMHGERMMNPANTAMVMKKAKARKY